MKTTLCQNEFESADFANQWLQDKVAEYRAHRVFLPSGSTPVVLYKKWETEKPEFLKHLEFTQLDEVTTGPMAGCFRKFFAAHLPSYSHQFADLDRQRDLPDLVVLGIGPNGHVAFHEPHVRDDFFKGTVELAPSTCERMGAKPGTEGLSFGVECFRQAKAILLLIRGGDKKQIAEEFLHNPKARFPAALLRSHRDITVLMTPECLTSLPAGGDLIAPV